MRLLSAFLAVGLLLGAPAPGLAQDALACEYWVSPTGSNSNPGTSAQPWQSLDHASASIPDAGCTVWLKDGTYTGTNNLAERFSIPTTFKAVNPFKVILRASDVVVQFVGARNIILEGFEIRHTGSGAGALLVYMQRSSTAWTESIVIRNNILHDSYNNDLLKVGNGSRFVTVEGNVFYNQTGQDEHIDINSATDVIVRDNIFFNDFVGSGRSNLNNTGQFIVVKDSNGSSDGQSGSERVAIRRNLFLNWQGDVAYPVIQLGEDSQPFFEASDVQVENNLILGNAANDVRAAFGVRAARNVTFVNNTVVGNLPGRAYAVYFSLKGPNPKSQNIVFYNNIWADPTGTMGAEAAGGANEFSDGDPATVTGLTLSRNLYWNGGAAIPPGKVLSPLTHDAARVVANPLLNTDYTGLVLPRWMGTAFASGSTTIRQEFVRLVNAYGRLPANSPAAGQANAAYRPVDDILGNPRLSASSLGAFEAGWMAWGVNRLTSLTVFWTDHRLSNAASLSLTYTGPGGAVTVNGISAAARSYVLTGLQPYTTYTVSLVARDSGNTVLAQSNSVALLTTDKLTYLPFVRRHGP